MKKLFLFSLFAVVFTLSFVSNARAEVNYTRTPSGAEITTSELPVNIQVSVGNYGDFGCSPERNYWTVVITKTGEDPFDYIGGNILASTSLNFNEDFDLPVDDYNAVNVICCSDEQCVYQEGMYPPLECIDENCEETIFSVVGEQAGTLFDLSGGFVANMLAWVSDTFTDLSPLIVIFIGLPLAFWGIARVIGLFNFGKVRKDD